MKKTKAIEILDQAKAEYELHSFVAEVFTAEEAAEKLKIPIGNVFKTLVARAENGKEVLAVVPGSRELNLKKLAQVLNVKRADMVDVNELQRLTGYIKGGVSPLGTKRRMPVFVDSSCQGLAFISVSAGLRGLQVFIAPAELLRVSGGQAADLS